MMTTTIIYTIIFLCAIGIASAVILYFVAQKFKVEEDPRIDIVESILPGANCGGCGKPGCRGFAEATVKATSLDGLFCPVGGAETMAKVASALGMEVSAQTPQIAVVRCNGTCDHRQRTSTYDGTTHARSSIPSTGVKPIVPTDVLVAAIASTFARSMPYTWMPTVCPSFPTRNVLPAVPA